MVGGDKALKKVIELRDQFVAKEHDKSGIFTDEVDINDYPQ